MQEETLSPLTLESLSREYSDWIKENGIGRNKDDWRFGQYLFNKYQPRADRRLPELFYPESATDAYIVAMNYLLDQEKTKRENNEH